MNYLQQFTLPSKTELCFCGPPLEEGPLPAIIYLAISGIDSLQLDPFNQMVSYLVQTYRIRVFSLDLPAHEPPLDPRNAIEIWSQEFKRGIDPLTPFLQKITKAADELIENGTASRIGIAGLSRGGFLAMHAAAKSSHLKNVLAFAPITRLERVKEFSSIPENPQLASLGLPLLYDRLFDKSIRIYIGNRDELVGTSSCFAFVQELTEFAYQKKIRSPQVEMIISPSIGYLGHGTSQTNFEWGAAWIANQLQAEYV